MTAAISALRTVVATELNYLLIREPSRQTDGGWDWGIYCREHAFCGVVLAHLLGERLRLVDSHVIIRGPKSHKTKRPTVLVSHGDGGGGHAWCVDDRGTILDFSLQFRHFHHIWGDTAAQLREPIYGNGWNGKFDVRALPPGLQPEDLERYAGCAGMFVGYLPHEPLSYTAKQLLENPGRIILAGVLIQPVLAITLHCYRLAIGEAEPVKRGADPQDACDSLPWGTCHYQLLLELVEERDRHMQR